MNLRLGATLAAAAAVGAIVGRKGLQRYVRRARDDYRRRPALWERFYAVDWGDTATNNYGYSPAQGDHPQRFQHEMYLQLLQLLRERQEISPGMTLLEVSCGRGGGLNALRDQAPELHATGLDIAASAIDFCRRTYGESDRLRFIQGSALDLPFPDESFDIVLNVEASNDYGDRRSFFQEVARVLKPGGVFLYADTFRADQRETMEQDLQAAGFIGEFRDVTANVVQACRLDTPRRLEVIRRHAPAAARLLFNNQLENYAAVAGSRKFRAFEEGRRGYVMTAAIRG